MRIIFYYLIGSPIILGGFIFIILGLILFTIAAVFCEIETFLIKCFNLKRSRGNLYRAFNSVWGVK